MNIATCSHNGTYIRLVAEAGWGEEDTELCKHHAKDTLNGFSDSLLCDKLGGFGSFAGR